MAVHTTADAVLKVGTATVAQVTSVTVDTASESVETTTLGHSTRAYTAGRKSWSGSAEVNWDETDTNGQIALIEGSAATLSFYPEGSASGAYYYSGAIIVTSNSYSAAIDGLVTASISFVGNGTLSRATV